MAVLELSERTEALLRAPARPSLELFQLHQRDDLSKVTNYIRTPSKTHGKHGRPIKNLQKQLKRLKIFEHPYKIMRNHGT